MMGLRMLVVAVLVLGFSRFTQAALVLTIDTYTTDELSFTLSGAFDENTTGDLPGYLAIKNDWSHNVAEHTELFSFQPTVTSNTIQIGDGLVPTQATVQDGTAPWTDTVFFVLTPPTNGNDFTALPFLAGMPVSGSMTLSGTGAFNPAHAATLEVVSRFNIGRDFARLEYSPVPLPAALPLFGSALGLMGFLGWRRRKAPSAG